MRKTVKRKPHINGRRGAFLLLWGLIYLLMGSSYFVSGRFPPALVWLGQFMEPKFLGLLWIVPAVFSISGAFRQRPRDAYAFSALVIAPVVWACLYIAGSFMSGEFTAVLGLIVFGGLAGTFALVAGMEGGADRAERILNPEET